MEFSSLSLIFLLIGFFHCSLSQHPVKPTVSVNWNSVYTGDSVTLTCDLQPATEFREFFWYRDDQKTTTTYSNTHTVELFYSGVMEFRCIVHEKNNNYTYYSDPVQITVSERPKPAVMINPIGGDVFRGEPVKLTCTIRDYQFSEWQYSWYKEGQVRVISTDQVYTISHVTETHSGKYTCRGSDHRGSSHFSDAVTLTVSEHQHHSPHLYSPPGGAVSVNQNSVYTGDSVTLTCHLQPATGWKWFTWYRDYQYIKATHSNTYSVQLSNSGVIKFECSAQAENNHDAPLSDSVQVTVSKRPKPTVMINPGVDVFSGEPVKLTCNIQDDKVSEWQYSWYKDDFNLVISTKQVYTISDFTESHSGKYTCRGSDHRGSSHISNAVTLTVSAVLSETINDL